MVNMENAWGVARAFVSLVLLKSHIETHSARRAWEASAIVSLWEHAAMDGSPSTNPYLSGNFAPVRSEDDFDLEVTGEFPAGLRGAFYRNGPNPQFEPRGHYHWFTGDGMIHGFFVDDGKVAIATATSERRNGSSNTRRARRCSAHSHPMAADPSVTGKDSGVANTNIVWHAGRLLALEEAHKPFEIDPESLKSRGYVEPYRGRVTAHPKIDPETGEMIWFGYSWGDGWFSEDHVLWRDRRQWPGDAPRRFRGPVLQHGARLSRDPPARAVSHPAADGQSSARDARRPGLRVGAGQRRACRGDGARRKRRDHALVHDRGLLRLPSDERVGGGRQDLRRRHGISDRAAVPQRRRVAPQRASARLVRWTFDLAGASDTIKREPLDDLAGEFPRFDERHAGLELPARLVRRARRRTAKSGCSTPSPISTSKPASGRLTGSAQATRQASRSSCRVRPARRRATDG